MLVDMKTALTFLAVRPGKPMPTHALVAVQHWIAATSILTHIFGAGMVEIHGHVTGLKGVITFQDGNTHQSDLRMHDKFSVRPQYSSSQTLPDASLKALTF